MAYRTNHIKDFIKNVNKEAEEAAQAIFDKHNAKLQEMVNNQVLKGQKLYVGMGTAVIEDSRKSLPYDYAKEFLDVISRTQYHEIKAGFIVNDCKK